MVTEVSCPSFPPCLSSGHTPTSASPLFLFRKEQGSHGSQQNMAYEGTITLVTRQPSQYKEKGAKS